LFHLLKLFRVLDQTGEEEANETVTGANHHVDVNRLADDSHAAAPAGNQLFSFYFHVIGAYRPSFLSVALQFNSGVKIHTFISKLKRPLRFSPLFRRWRLSDWQKN